MRVGVICPGPSLGPVLECGGRPTGEVLVGVNRAAAACRVDWWVFGDARVFEHTDPRGCPNILTSAASATTCARMTHRAQVAQRHAWFTVEEHVGDPLPDFPWTLYSVLMAAVLAWRLGAREIVLWGCDQRGTRDWDGVDNSETPAGRAPARWERERALIAELTERLAARHVAMRKA